MYIGILNILIIGNTMYKGSNGNLSAVCVCVIRAEEAVAWCGGGGRGREEDGRLPQEARLLVHAGHQRQARGEYTHPLKVPTWAPSYKLIMNSFCLFSP